MGGTIAYSDTAANRVTTGGRFGARVQIASTVTYTDFDNLAATLIPDPPRGTIVTVR